MQGLACVSNTKQTQCAGYRVDFLPTTLQHSANYENYCKESLAIIFLSFFTLFSSFFTHSSFIHFLERSRKWLFIFNHLRRAINKTVQRIWMRARMSEMQMIIQKIWQIIASIPNFLSCPTKMRKRWIKWLFRFHTLFASLWLGRGERSDH